MANKKISELESRASLSLSDLMAVGDPSTGYLYKTTISDLKTLTGAGVVSFNGRFGTVNPAEGDYTLTQLGDVIITSPSNTQLLQYNGSNWVNWTPNYLTSYTETDTLDSVTGRGNTTANSITVGSVTAAGLSNLLGQIRTFATTGNTYIGASPASATDAGYKLDLNGTARISGDMSMWDDGSNNGNSRALIFRALGSTGNVQTGQIILDGFGAAGQDQLQLSASNIRLAPSTGSVTITGTTPNISTVAASGFRLNANSTTNGFIFTQAYNQTSGDLLAIFTNSNQKRFSVSHAGIVTVADLAGTGSRMVVADASGNLSTQAIPSTSGFVTLDTTQTITALKTFTNVVTFNQNIVGGLIKLSQGVLLSKSANIGSDPGFLSLIATSSTGLNTINIADGDNASFTQKLIIPNTGNYNYTFPASSGTLALTSDIPSVAGVYLPLAGGTLTGALNGTSAVFSSTVTAKGFINDTASSVSSSGGMFRLSNGYTYFVGSSTGNGAIVGNGDGTATIQALSPGGSNGYLIFETGSGSEAMRVTSGRNVLIGGSTLYNPTFAQRFLSLDAGTSGDNTAMMQMMGSRTVDGTFGALEFMHQSQANRVALRAKRSGANNSVGFDILVTNAGSTATALDIASTGAATFSSSVTAATYLTLSEDGTYTGTYYTLGFSGTSNGANRIFAARDGSDGIYIAAATNRTINFRAGGGTTNHLTIASTGAATFSSSVTTAGTISSIVSNSGGDGGILFVKNSGSATLNSKAVLAFATDAGGTATNNPRIQAILKNTGNGASDLEFFVHSGAGVINKALTLYSTSEAFFSSSVTASGNVTISSTTNASLVAATNSTTGFTFIDLINNGASGRNYQIGVGGNGAASGYANNLYFDLVGVGNIMTLTSSRNVGIGTANPSNILTVVGGAASPVALNLSTANSNCDIVMTSGAGGGLVRLRNNLNDFQVHTNGTLAFTLASNQAATFSSTITAGGNINLPASGVLTASSSGATIYVHAGATYPGGTIEFVGGIAGSNAGNLIFRTGITTGLQAEAMRITEGGNVQIATGSIKTGNPSGSTARPWKLGEDTGTLYTATRTISVEINGSVYYLLAVKSSDL